MWLITWLRSDIDGASQLLTYDGYGAGEEEGWAINSLVWQWRMAMQIHPLADIEDKVCNLKQAFIKHPQETISPIIYLYYYINKLFHIQNRLKE